VAKPLNIALLGADDPLGEAVLRLLSERDIELGELFPLSMAESDGCVTLRGEELPLLEVAGFDWTRADVLLNATRAPAAGRIESSAALAGCRVIGLGQGDAPGRIAVEGGLAVALQRVLAPLRQEAGLAALAVTAMLPVAAAGEAGVAELAGQTRALFAMESIEPEAFPLQIAFNLIPQVGAIGMDSASSLERDTAAELRTLLDSSGLPVSLTAIWAPLFYGAALTVHASTAAAVDLAALRARLADLPGVTCMDTGLPGGVATPATDAQDSEAVFVGRLRAGADPQHDVSMWLVLDLMRLEAARLVDRLENLFER
ncbi:MAG: Asd/ArgC dimerization domain-containing protein, partial [Gallionellaceae bacterium]|nr:Asd/ArgC dimerization domain-containing protein [Gallionellaceae bacterium]